MERPWEAELHTRTSGHHTQTSLDDVNTGLHSVAQALDIDGSEDHFSFAILTEGKLSNKFCVLKPIYQYN